MSRKRGRSNGRTATRNYVLFDPLPVDLLRHHMLPFLQINDFCCLRAVCTSMEEFIRGASVNVNDQMAQIVNLEWVSSILHIKRFTMRSDPPRSVLNRMQPTLVFLDLDVYLRRTMRLDCPELRQLILRSSHGVTVSGSMPKLEKIWLHKTSPPSTHPTEPLDMRFLRSCSHLQLVTVEGYSCLEPLNWLDGCTAREVRLRQLPITVLSHAPQLRSLLIVDCPNILNIDVLRLCSRLHTVDLHDLSVSLEPLEQLPALERLKCALMPWPDVSRFANLKVLQVFHVTVTFRDVISSTLTDLVVIMYDGLTLPKLQCPLLQVLDILGCPSITHLHALPPSLRELSVVDMANINSLELPCLLQNFTATRCPLLDVNWHANNNVLSP